MVFLRKFLVKILISVFVISFLILSPYFLFTKINELNYSLNPESDVGNSKILTLYNIDTFEGGSYARSVFLEKRAQEFEKENKGIYIIIKNLTLEQLSSLLVANKTPNIITFGIGVEDSFVNKLIVLEDFGVRGDLIKGGYYNSQLLAVPIILGGYSLISNKEIISSENILEGLQESKNPNLIFSSNENISPLVSLIENGLEIKEQEIEQLNSFDAYDKFINEKYNVLLGTQRDYYRCKNREKNLKMQCNYQMLGGFSDLIQYASVFRTNSLEEEYSKNFIKFLSSFQVQQKLENINMFPVINQNIYTDEDYKSFNDVLLRGIKTINVFSKSSQIKSFQKDAQDYVFGKIAEKKVIEKYYA